MMNVLDKRGWRSMMAYRFAGGRVVKQVVARGREVVVQVRGGVKFIVPTYEPRG